MDIVLVIGVDAFLELITEYWDIFDENNLKHVSIIPTERKGSRKMLTSTSTAFVVIYVLEATIIIIHSRLSTELTYDFQEQSS